MVPSDSTPDDAASTSPTNPRVRTHTSRGQRNQWIAIVILSGAVVFMGYEQVSANYTANVATGAAEELAEPVDQLCRTDPSARRAIGETGCDRAAEVQQSAVTIVAPRPGRDGRDGDDGRGIAATAVVDGHLFVTYTDGVREDKGVVAVDGVDGRGITGARLDDEGQLVLTYTDGAVEVVGRVVGRDGVDGRGVSDVTVTADYHIVVTYTDGTVEDVGVLPVGPAGRGVLTIEFDLDSCVAQVYYTDGESENKTMTGCTPEDDDHEPPGLTTTTIAPAPTGGLLPPG